MSGAGDKEERPRAGLSRVAEEEVLARIEKGRRRKARLVEEHITLAHGAGGKATRRLVESLFLEAFRNPVLEALAAGTRHFDRLLVAKGLRSRRLSEAIRRADKAGKLTSEGIKDALETFKDFDMGGLTGNVTYSPTDHRPETKTPIYQIQGGKLVKVAEFDMPRKPEWLGL